MKMQKNSMLKRGLAVLLAVVMCVGLAMPAWAADGTSVKEGDVIGYCICNAGNLIYDSYQDYVGYTYHCDWCGSNGAMSSLPAEPLTPKTHSIIDPGEEKCEHNSTNYVFATETDQWTHMHYCVCSLCKETVSSDYCEDKNGNGNCDTCGHSMQPTTQDDFTGFEEGKRYEAACGGSFVWRNGKATEIIPGPKCLADPKEFDQNKHDHQCDFCHRDYAESEWKETKTIGTPSCFSGAKTETKCWYDGCTVLKPVTTYGEPLAPVFPDTWECANELQHYHNCVNCNGDAEDHVDYEPHDMGDWSEWTLVESLPGGVLPEGVKDFNPDTQTLWVSTSVCKDCGYKIVKYKTESEDPKKHTLTIKYMYADDNGEKGPAFPPHVGKYAEGETYEIKSPDAPEGYQIESGMDYVRGVMSTGDTVWTVKYKPIPYKVVVKYVEAGTNELIGEPYEETHYIGDEVKITPTAPEGWKLVKPATPIEFTMGAEDEEIWIHCERLTEYKVTVNYVDENHNAIADADPVTVTTTNGGEYNVNGLKVDIENYTYVDADKPLTGKVVEDTTITLTYRQNEETVTVTWLPGYGTNAAIKVKPDHVKGAPVPSSDYPADPSRSGYRFTGWGAPVTDTVTGNITITAQWRYITPGPDPTPTPTPTPTPDPTPSPEPTDEPTDIPDPMPPLTESPDVTPTPSTPPVSPDPEPSVEIPDEDPPLAEIPDEDPPLAEIPDDTTEIDDEDVPLADVPKTGDDAKIWLTLALLSAAGLGVIGLMQRRTRKNGRDS